MSADLSECGPIASDIAVIAVTTSSGATDLATVLSTITNKRRFRMICSQALYYRFSVATGTADETAVTGNKVSFLPAATLSPPMRLRSAREGETIGLAQWLLHKAGGAGYLRIYFCDQPTG